MELNLKRPLVVFDLESTGLNIGGVAAYVNCPKGTKVKANFKTEQSSVTGTFFAEEDEE